MHTHHRNRLTRSTQQDRVIIIEHNRQNHKPRIEQKTTTTPQQHANTIQHMI